VTEEVRAAPAEHVGDLGHGFDLHVGAGATAVACVVVRVNGHRKGVGGASDGVGRLKHLAGIERMEVRVIVAQPSSGLVEHGGHGFDGRGGHFG
jgi:hypothetical protein